MPYFVYLMASRKNGTLYVGVTSNLIGRVYQHKEGTFEGFTKEHEVKMLVWFETTDCVTSAIQKEKQMKNWKRDWKVQLIERQNPQWRDLYPDILGMQ